MSLPSIEPIPDESSTLPPARRRRQRRMILPYDSGERAEFLHELARRTVPSFDFFLFSLLAGIVLGIAMLLDAPALFILAALLAPFMAPAIGIALGTVTGAGRFILQSLGSLSIGSLIVFLCGAIAGWAAGMLPGRTYQQAAFHSQFTWPDFFVLVVGAALTTYLIARAPNQKPLVSSVAIAYGIYLPAGAAGFGLSSGLSGLWPNGLVLFLVHLIWAALASVIVLALLGLRPLNASGYVLSAVYGLAGLAALFAFYAPQTPPQVRTPTPVEVAQGIEIEQATVTPSKSPSPLPPTITPSSTPTRTLVPTRTPTITITPAPTPVWARINASEGGGALIREKPDYNATVVTSILNNTLVEVLPEVTNSSGAAWVHIRTVNGKEGWIVRSLLRTATPAPGW